MEEGTSVRITEYDLQVVHAQMEPEDIKYTVTSGQDYLTTFTFFFKMEYPDRVDSKFNFRTQ